MSGEAEPEHNKRSVIFLENAPRTSSVLSGGGGLLRARGKRFWVATGKISTKNCPDFLRAGTVLCPHVPSRIQHLLLEPLRSRNIPAQSRRLQNQLFRQRASRLLHLRAHPYCSSVFSNPLQSFGQTATDFAAGSVHTVGKTRRGST